MWEDFDSLKPTITLIVGSIVSHIWKDNKELTQTDLMLILSPMIPTLVPIIMSMFKSTCQYMYEYFVKY